MKNLNYLKVLTLFFILSSCNKDENLTSNFSEELIIGNWEIAEFNVSDSSQEYTYNDFYNSSFNTYVNPIGLTFDKYESYGKNYVTGSWNFNGNALKLTPNENLSLSAQNYEIIELSENTLSLKIILNKNQYPCSWYFTDFEDNDLIYITEKYIRK